MSGEPEAHEGSRMCARTMLELGMGTSMPWHRICGPSQEQSVEETHGVGAGSRFPSLPDPPLALGPPCKPSPAPAP